LEEAKGELGEKLTDDLLDKVAKNYYSCPKSSCRKTFNEIEKLFTHAKIHSTSKNYLCTVPGCE